MKAIEPAAVVTTFSGFNWITIIKHCCLYSTKEPYEVHIPEEIMSTTRQLACVYLKGHLPGWALDWFDVLGYKVVEDKATDYAHLKEALTEQFPVVRNRSELETRFYASFQKHNQNSSNFVSELLKVQKQLKLDMREEKLLNHVISRLEPQLLDYVEVRHPHTTSNLLQIIDKYEERFLNRRIRGSSQEFRAANQNASNRFPNRNRQENWREARVNNQYSDNSRPQRKFNRFEGQGVGDNRRFDNRRRSDQSDHRFNKRGGRQCGSRNGAFRGQNGQNRISSLRMTPVELPYVPILLNETFITALWDPGAEKSFISEEIYRRYFSYRPCQKTKDRVVVAQGALCCHLGRVELQIRIRDFQKTWEFHIFNNMQHQCILGIDFMRESK
ncbi:uncharacterized protein TNCV_846671 [Trichonephila clavipes]|nr:uncharacterized protein TNCV_846671 [Trichonephila clavipes]